MSHSPSQSGLFSAQRFHCSQMLHDALVPGSRVNTFDHSRVSMAHQVGDLCGSFAGFLHLRAEGRAKIRIGITADAEMGKGTLADPLLVRV